MDRQISIFKSSIKEHLIIYHQELIIDAISSRNFEELLSYDEFNIYELYYTQCNHNCKNSSESCFNVFFNECTDEKIINHLIQRSSNFYDYFFLMINRSFIMS